MLGFIQDKTEEFFDDFSYNTRRSFSYILGKSGITAIAPGVTAGLADSLGSVGSVFAGSQKGMIIAAPLSAAFSAALVQGDFMHHRKRLLEQYRPEISAWLNNGRPPEDQTIKDLYLAAFGDEARGIPANPTLREAMTQNAKERNWGIGISIASTTASTFAAHEAEHSLHDFWTEQLGAGTQGIETATILSMGALGFAIYQAVKTPLHWLAECCFGVEKETFNDSIEKIRRVREAGKPISQQDIFESYLQAHPELDDMIRKEYGRSFKRMHKGDKAELLQKVGEKLHLEELCRDINSGQVRPEELAFAAFDQKSGVPPREQGVKREERPEGSLTKLAGRAARALGYGKKGQAKAEDLIESIPPLEQDIPAYMGLAASSSDGNTQVAVQAFHEETPGRSTSFAQKVGRKRGVDGSMSFVEQVESSRSSELSLGRT